MAKDAPPGEVLFAFLGELNATVGEFGAGVIPVVRGSFLMRHWLGDEARPAADIDLECFAGLNGGRGDDVALDDPDFDPEEGRYGPYGEYESLVDYGKAMCRYAANSAGYRSNHEPEVVFQEADPPAGGVSLWTYGTPGERYYAGWTLNTTHESGLLQIDVASSGYLLEDIATTTIEIELDGEAVECPAYAPETLLAAKLSWLLRSFTKDDTGTLAWKGEPKDLFDACLILTRLELEAKLFRKSLLAIGIQDQLDWNMLPALINAGNTLKDKDFANWPAFRRQHKTIVECGPTEMLRDVAQELIPLLGDFYPVGEMPFILAANAATNDELTLLVHADWLDDHDRPGLAAFVREYAKYDFHFAELTPAQQSANRAALKAGFDSAPRPWLLQFFGNAAAVSTIREQLEKS